MVDVGYFICEFGFSYDRTLSQEEGVRRRWVETADVRISQNHMLYQYESVLAGQHLSTTQFCFFVIFL